MIIKHIQFRVPNDGKNPSQLDVRILFLLSAHLLMVHNTCTHVSDENFFQYIYGADTFLSV